jgi:hypothetical protein
LGRASREERKIALKRERKTKNKKTKKNKKNKNKKMAYCAPYDALFIRPQTSAWQLVGNVRGVTLGAKKLTAVSLAGVVQCPRELYALRGEQDGQAKFVSVRGDQCVMSDDSALPVRVWMRDTSVVLEAPCGPFDTAEKGTFLTVSGGDLRYVGSEFEYDALAENRAILHVTVLSRG